MVLIERTKLFLQTESNQKLFYWFCLILWLSVYSLNLIILTKEGLEIRDISEFIIPTSAINSFVL